MDVWLNAMPSRDGGFGRPLIGRVRKIGFEGFRIGLAHDPQLTEPVLEELSESPEARHIWLIAGGKMTKGYPSREYDDPWGPDELVEHAREQASLLARYGFSEPIIEVGNEPDLAHDFWRTRPLLLGQIFRDSANAIRDVLPQATVLCPSISNLDKDSLEYLRRVFRGEPPLGTGCAFHRYPFATNALDPHPGFANRYQEIEAVRQIVGKETPLYVTECGIHEGPHIRKRLFGLCKKKFWLSETDVAEVVTDDLRFWLHTGVRGAALYQLNSGPDRGEREHSYGIRRFEEPWDGEWKPVAQALPAIIKEVA